MNLSGLIFVAACVFLSMKLLPEARTLIFLLAMMPMFLLEAASTSADAVTNGVCFLATAWLLSLRKTTEKFSRAEIFGLIILAIMLACVKSVYGTILLLYFLIPRERCKKFWRLGAAILFLNLFISAAWSWLTLKASGAAIYTNYYIGFSDTNAAAQKIFLTQNPAAFFAAILNSFAELWATYAINFIGSWGILWDVMLPPIFYFLYGITIIFFALSNGLKFKLGERAILIFAAVPTILAMFLMNYLNWSSVGSEIIRGVQGRYFIPLAPMIFGALSCLPPLKHKNLIALVAGVAGGVIMLYTNFLAFY